MPINGMFYPFLLKFFSLVVNSKDPVCFQGDGDYELVKDVEFDDYLRNRIAKV